MRTIEEIATKNPMVGHKISELDEHTQRIYLKYLANIINLTNDQNIRYSQILFLNRIIKGIKNSSINIKDVILTSLNQKLDLDEFIKCISNDIVDLFVVDSLIISNITGNIEKQSLEYVSEIISLFNLKNDKFYNLVNLAKFILERNDDKIEEYCSKCNDLDLFLCYMKNPYDGVIVHTLEQAKNHKVKKIILYNCHIKNKTKSINLDEFYADEIIFINCKFENIQGIYSIFKKKVFKHCDFFNINTNKNIKNSFAKRGLIVVYNCLFYNCNFKNCNSSTTFINGENCEIEKCLFENCKLNECESEEGLIVVNNSRITNSILNNCSIKINKKDIDNENLSSSFLSALSIINKTNKEDINKTTSNIIRIRDGEISNCEFKKCSIDILCKYNRFYDTFIACIINIYYSTCMECKFDRCSVNITSANYYHTSKKYVMGMFKSYEKNNNFIKCKNNDFKDGLVGNIE